MVAMASFTEQNLKQGIKAAYILSQNHLKILGGLFSPIQSIKALVL